MHAHITVMYSWIIFTELEILLVLSFESKEALKAKICKHLANLTMLPVTSHSLSQHRYLYFELMLGFLEVLKNNQKPKPRILLFLS